MSCRALPGCYPASLSLPCPVPCPHFPSPSPQPLARRQQRRSFFNIFQKPPRQIKEPDFEPGYDVLLQFRKTESEGARPPDRDELVNGWLQFIRHKKRRRKGLNQTQAFLAMRLLRYLIETETEGYEDITIEDLRAALHVVMKPPKGNPESHLELAKLLYEEIDGRIQRMRKFGLDENTIRQITGGAKGTTDFENYLKSLAQYGGALEAVDCFSGYLSQVNGAELPPVAKVLWVIILRGLAKEGREEELLREFQAAEAAGVEFSPNIHEIMVTFYGSRNQVEEAKYWFERPVHANWRRTPEAYMQAIKFALRNDEQEWLQRMMEELVNSKPGKEWWNIILYWAVVAMDKGAEEVKQMIRIMMSTPPTDGVDPPVPDTTTLDALIRAATEKQNPYLAERFLSIGHELGIELKASTYLLQMDYRLDAKDFSGVQAIYAKFRRGEVPIENEEDLPVVNKYIRALCSVKNPDIDRILDIVADLEHRQATLEPETVAAICTVLLRNDNQFEVIDTLSMHTVSYSLEERAQVRGALIDFILDPKVSTARVWDCYSLLRQYFPETPPADRVRLMDAFFARKRPDMAAYIFGHMRSHDNPAMHPTEDVYIRCLEGFARLPDPDSLRMVHNMLKMDTKIQMTTRLYNALMLGYVACDDPGTALEFWRDITNSREGPSYNSLEIVFWACERLPYGDRTARQIWAKMQRLDLEVPPQVFWAYCGALAGSGHVDEVIRLIRGMDVMVGYGPGLMT